jgi:hypothetical protein
LKSLEHLRRHKISSKQVKGGRDITFSPSTVQRETVIDPVAPVDIPRNITIGHERLV